MKTSTRTVGPAEVRANRLDLIGRLADDLAHEVRNPLHSMVINLELLRGRLAEGDAEGGLPRIPAIEDGMVRLQTLVDGLLLLLRPARQPNGPLSLAAVLADLLPLLDLQARLARVRFDHGPVGDAALIAGRPDHLCQAVLNLFMNALDAVGPGGCITLTTSLEPGWLRLYVRDDGPGVPADAIGRLGDPGFTTRPGRPGLGLAVAAALAEAAGGRIDLESAGGEGSGASFCLSLPRAGGA